MNINFQLCSNTDVPIKERKLIKSEISRILWAIRYAIKHSSSEIKRNANEDFFERQNLRMVTIENLRFDLSICILHGVGHHEQCRPEMCNNEAIIPEALKTALHSLFIENSTDTVLEKLKLWFMNVSPEDEIFELANTKKIRIINQTKKALDKKISLIEANIVDHVFQIHTGCSSAICSMGSSGSLDAVAIPKLINAMLYVFMFVSFFPIPIHPFDRIFYFFDRYLIN
jgi:hypothetical protein